MNLYRERTSLPHPITPLRDAVCARARSVTQPGGRLTCDLSRSRVEAVPAGSERTCATESVCVGACVCVSPFDVICVSCVVSLQLLVHIKEDNHGGDEVHRLPGGQQVKVGAAVATAVAIAGISPGSRNNRKTAGFLQKFSPRLPPLYPQIQSQFYLNISFYPFGSLLLSPHIFSTNR